MKDKFWGSQEEKQRQPSIHEMTAESLGHASEDFNAVEFANNRIFFYSGVTRPKILKLNKGIYTLSTSMISKANTLNYTPPNIDLHINSYGGSVFAGLAAVDYIKNCKVPVETTIDGCAASAATLMSIVGTHRKMQRNACMLIHQLSGHMWGKFQEMQDDMENSEMLMKKIISLYEEHTKIPKKEINNLLKRDIWWESDTCLKYGLVDEII
jgi:ATP-dependent Clp endopeptidase proteolytic subunit ClpP